MEGFYIGDFSYKTFLSIYSVSNKSIVKLNVYIDKRSLVGTNSRHPDTKVSVRVFRGQFIKNLFMNAWQGLGTDVHGPLVGAYYRRGRVLSTGKGVSLCVSRRAICSTFFPSSF